MLMELRQYDLGTEMEVNPQQENDTFSAKNEGKTDKLNAEGRLLND
jgi:hypothetical protein